MEPVRSHPTPLDTSAQWRTTRRLVRNALDRGGALLLLAVMLPALVVIAIAIVASSPGPVLARSTRVVRGGGDVTVLRFRTTGTTDDDVTPVGQFLHRHALDELPRLLNVLRGQLPLLGPRATAR